MTTEEILDIQKEYFATGETLSVEFRKLALKKLWRVLDKNEEKINTALKLDLGKSASESYMCEIGLVKSEISYMLSHIDSYAKEKTVPTPMVNFLGRSFEKPSPYGNVLIVSPWNYPLLLTLDPLVDAIAAGNTAILKPSAYSPRSSAVIKAIIELCFPPEYVAVVTGGRAENEQLFSMDFDYIFFTGSKTVGKEVLRKAADRLIPVTLELGGKSPCVVDETANIKIAAKRIVFGKLLNCGQTCVAPDYIYCHESVKEELLSALEREIGRQYGVSPLENENYGKIINEKHYNRLINLIDEKKVVYGGERNPDTLRLAPTVMDNVTWDDAVMGEEIFGPIIPILTYSDTDEAIENVRNMPSPLALYIFSSSKTNISRWENEVPFGGGCINDTIIHIAESTMRFGGVGASGMGTYHGKAGFDTFTHYKSMVDKKTFPELPFRCQPYAKWKDLVIRLFVR